MAAGSAARLGTLGRSILAAGGASAFSAPIEAAMEAGAVYEEAKRRGMSDEEAERAADRTFWGNMATLGITNATEFATAFLPGRFGRIGRALERPAARIGATGAQGAIEEGLQEYISSSSLGDDFSFTDPETLEAMVVGGLMGAGFGASGSAFDSIRRRVVDKLPDAAKAEVRTKTEQYKVQGLEENLAETRAVDDVLEQLPNTQEIVNEAVQEQLQEFDRQVRRINTQRALDNLIAQRRQTGELPASSVEFTEPVNQSDISAQVPPLTEQQERSEVSPNLSSVAKEAKQSVQELATPTLRTNPNVNLQEMTAEQLEQMMNTISDAAIQLEDQIGQGTAPKGSNQRLRDYTRDIQTLEQLIAEKRKGTRVATPLPSGIDRIEKIRKKDKELASFKKGDRVLLGGREYTIVDDSDRSTVTLDNGMVVGRAALQKVNQPPRRENNIQSTRSDQPPFKVGDRVAYESFGGSYTGTVRNVNNGHAWVKEDQTGEVVGVPLGNATLRKISEPTEPIRQKDESGQPQQEQETEQQSKKKAKKDKEKKEQDSKKKEQDSKAEDKDSLSRPQEESKDKQKDKQVDKKDKEPEKPKEPRKNAYEEEKPGKVAFTDSKGTWEVTRLSLDNRQAGKNKYLLHITFKPSKNTKSDDTKFAYVPAWEDTTKEQLKDYIKRSVGYTPQPNTMDAIYERFQELKKLREEEDLYYSSQDKKKAQKTFNELLDKAVERYKKGEEFEPEYGRRLSFWQRYLSPEERKQLIEAQKIINGYAYVDDTSDHGSFFKPFISELNKRIEKINSERRAKAQEEKDKRLADMMEKDPEFRKFVAHWNAIGKTPARDKWTEMVHRMFGYTTNEEQFRKNEAKLKELFRKFGLDPITDRYLLDGIAKKEEILPAVQPPHVREEGKIYYGDIVHDGKEAMEVKKVGRKLIHYKGWGDPTIPIDKVQLLEKVDLIEKPKTVDDWLFNIKAVFHNEGKIINAHEMSLEEFAAALREKFKNSSSYNSSWFKRAAENTTNKERKHALQMIGDEIRMQQLEKELIPQFKYHKQLQEKFKKELNELKAKYKEEKPAVKDKDTKEDAAKIKDVTAKTVKAEGKTEIAATERGTSVMTRFAVVNIDDVVTSHDTNLKPNKKYPSELQPRDRSRKSSEDQITRIIAHLNPEFLGTSPKASEGAPIIGKDMIVESGNGRTIALKRAYEQEHQSATKYKEWLIQNAERFGIDPEEVRALEKPFLVRIRETDVDRVQFAKEANEQSVAALSATEQAKADAERLTSGMLDFLVPNETGEIDTRENQDFILMFMQTVVGPAERGRYMTADGRLSQEGVTRIRNAIFAKAYGDTQTIEKLAESTDNNVRNITNAMLMAAPRIARMKEEIASGNLYNLDITEDIAQAVNKLSDLRREKTEIKDYLAQINMFGDELSDVAKNLLDVFDKYKRSTKKLANVLYHYVNVVEAAGNPKQMTLFENEPPTKNEILEIALRKAEAGEDATQNTLWDFAAQDLAETGTGSTVVRSEKETAGKKVLGDLGKVESKMAREVDRNVRGISEIGIVPQVFQQQKKKEQGQSKYAFLNEEAEKRWQSAKEVPKPTLVEKLKETLVTFRNKLFREFEHLPRTAEFSKLRNELLRLEKQRDISNARTLQLIQGITIELNPDQFDLFERAVILNDLMEEAKKGHSLPFGFTEESLAKEHERIMNFVNQDQKVLRALQKRQEVWDGIKQEYIKAMNDVGFDVAKRLQNENYYRHIVLAYVNEKRKPGTGRKLRTPTGSSYIKKREGSELDILTDYLAAETEVMSHMMYDTEVAKVIKLVDDHYNIARDLEKLADEHNQNELNKLIDAEKAGQKLDERIQQVIDIYKNDLGIEDKKTEGPQEVQGEFELEGVEEVKESQIETILNLFNKRMAMGFSRLRKLADELWTGETDEFKKAVDLLKSRKKDPIVFRYLGELAKREDEFGSEFARQILYNLNRRERFKEEVLGDRLKTSEDFIPEGYTTWQPREGHIFYMGNTVPEEIAKQLWEEIVDKLTIEAGDLRKQLVVGGKRREFIVKEEVAAQLDELIPEEINKGFINRLNRDIIRLLKIQFLISPTRWFKYNFRNMTGDLDKTIAGNPKGILKAPQAAVELYDVFFRDRGVTDEMREWMKRGGIQTLLQAQEMGDVKELRMFLHLQKTKQSGLGAKLLRSPKDFWNWYWRVARHTTDYREAIMRYANYLSYLEQMQKNGGKPDNFGASIPEEVMALDDIRDRAFKLSNELLIAYDQTSVIGKELREHWYPFWSFAEGNFRSYVQLIRNAAKDDKLAQAIGRKLVGTVVFKTPYYAYRIGALVLKVSAVTILLSLWNNLFFEDEEKELPEDVRRRLHIVLGRDENGEIRYFDRLGTLEDFLEWFGVDDLVTDFQDILNNRRTLAEVIRDNLLKAPNKLVQGANPFLKVLGEQLTGYELYPKAYEPQPIEDRVEHIARIFGLNKEYEAAISELLGRPSKPYNPRDLFDYGRHPGEAAYYDLKEIKRKYMKRIGKGSVEGGFSRSKKSEVLYQLKRAIRYNDEEAYQRYLKEYFILHIEPDKSQSDVMRDVQNGLKQSFRTMHPLYGLNEKERAAFVASLSREDFLKLVQARIFFEEEYLKKVPFMSAKDFKEYDAPIIQRMKKENIK
ncbi:hypothetical protein BSNK01_11780 [Bacillaceae bacterium]